MLLIAIIASLMIPFQATLIPIYQLVSDLGWVNTYAGLIAPRAADAFGIFFLRQFFLSLPRDLDNAARIDGASEWRIFWSVVLPNARPALLTLAHLHLREQLERPALAARVHHRRRDGNDHVRTHAADRSRRDHPARRHDGRLPHRGAPARDHVPPRAAALHRERRLDRPEMRHPLTDWYTEGPLQFGLGIENTFVPQDGPGLRPIDEYELTEHYTRWRSDLDLAAGVGAEFLRWGIPWHRVNPEPGRWDWGWTDRVIGRLVELGMRPDHRPTPLRHPAVAGRTVRRTGLPAAGCRIRGSRAERYSDLVTDYTPVNEPMIHVLFCGEYGYWPPYLRGESGAAQLAMAIAKGFQATQHGIREVLGERATFVHVDASMRYVGAVDTPEHRETAERLRHQAFLVEDLVTGRVRADHPLLDFLLRHGAEGTPSTTSSGALPSPTSWA